MCVHIYIYISLGSNERDLNHFSKKTKVRSAGDLDLICVLYCIHFWTTFGSLWDPLVDQAACSDLVMPVLRCLGIERCNYGKGQFVCGVPPALLTLVEACGEA